MLYHVYGHDKATHRPRSEMIASAKSREDAIVQAESMGIEVDRIEEVVPALPPIPPDMSGPNAGGEPPPEHRNLMASKALGVAFCIVWAVIVLPFVWYWIFPGAKGSFSFGMVLVVVLSAPLLYAFGDAIGQKLEKALERMPARRLWIWAMAVAMIAVVLVDLFFSSYIYPPSPVSWVNFTSEPGGFSVSMPGNPQESQETRPVLSFSLTMHTFKSTTAGGQGDCFLSYADYSESMMKQMGMNPAEILDASCRGIGTGGRGKLIEVRSMALADHPGRELTCERYDQGPTYYLRCRLYLVDRRLYQLGFASRRQERTSSKDADAFLASFKLIEKSAMKGHAE